MFILNDDLIFPPTNEAFSDGLLCMGGDLSVERLLLAYSKGIFPWSDGEPILWYSPDPRFVLFPHKLRISKSMKQLIRKNEYTWTFNQCFEEVIRHCRTNNRKDELGTWIDDNVEQAYIKLHQLGHAYSAECWRGNALVGGLYGVRVNTVFCGESMFSLDPNASKFAFIHLVQYLRQQGIGLVDCQVYTKHLDSLGAEMISREEFQTFLQ